MKITNVISVLLLAAILALMLMTRPPRRADPPTIATGPGIATTEPRPRPTCPKWQYLWATLYEDPKDGGVEMAKGTRELDERGKEGWEAYAVLRDDSARAYGVTIHRVIVLMRRPIQD